MTQPSISVRSEIRAFAINGYAMLALALLTSIGVVALCAIGIARGTEETPAPLFFVGLAASLPAILMYAGLYTVQPNEARVLVLFGKYTGSNRAEGFWWSNPFAQKKRASLRVHNFNSEKLKVNDANGNPIEIAAVVAWRVVDSAKALFDVEAYGSFVSVQAETAIRTLAARYPYDTHGEETASLRGSPDEVGHVLREELQERLAIAGVEVLDARISHLAYAPEIAQAMLRRQQAQAVIAARQQIVEGAVGMVEMALRRLSENRVLELDEERKANMVSNLMVVLVSESETQPIINTGTLY